jgi:hypothetical protein
MNVLPSASPSHELGADLNAAEGGSLRPGKGFSDFSSASAAVWWSLISFCFSLAIVQMEAGMRGRQSQALAKSSSYDDLSRLPFEDEYFCSGVADLSSSSPAVAVRYGSVN